MKVIDYSMVEARLVSTMGVTPERRQKMIREAVSCPTCQRPAGEWCRKMPDGDTMVVRTGKRWGQRRRVICHDARVAKYEMFCEAT